MAVKHDRDGRRWSDRDELEGRVERLTYDEHMRRSNKRASSLLGVFLLVVIALVCMLTAATQEANAATYVESCATPPGAPLPGTISDDAIETAQQREDDAQNCRAIVERLEAVAGQLAALDEDGSTTAQRVSLAPLDRNRLDLVWWGVWAIVGLTLVLLFSSKWHSAWRFMRE